ncbi:hypothetical protein EJ03DRAFT_326058 [Teratosphaeria nubilosa]|uniref:Major facilitator superfamily (MFS) profile domain-containing protein n=1 Tax=Teratosphaeria nubilosa TaxID=161662 RepID=A0A6G1LEK0_9PEZI|nr:hypothetical protein EJ03DRAFT_326058 [Teratosphaeria nubilosa]
MNGRRSPAQGRDDFHNPTGSSLGLFKAARSIASVLNLPVLNGLFDRYGRNRNCVCDIAGVIIATIIQNTPTTPVEFVVLRHCGCAAMFIVQPSPMLIVELAYPTHKDKCTSAYWCMSWRQDYPSTWRGGYRPYSKRSDLLYH